MLATLRGDLLEGPLEAVFELGAVDQIGKLIVARVVGELHGVFLPEFQFLEFALGAIDSTDHALRKPDTDRNESARNGQYHKQQRGFDPACGLAQGIREPVLPGLQLLVDLNDVAQNGSELGTVHPAGEVNCMEVARGSVEPCEELVSGPPDVEDALHVADSVKALIQAYYTGDIVRVGTPLDKAGPHDRIVGIGLFELEPRLAEAERYADRLAVVEKIRL